MSGEKDRSVTVYSGIGWGTGWLFTIGFVNLGFWKSAIALFIWPWILGAALHG